MYNKYITTLFSILLSIFAISANAQSLKSFSEDRSSYLKELEELMTSSKRKVMEDAYKDYKNSLKVVFSPMRNLPKS